MAGSRFRIFVLTVAVLLLGLPAQAQIRRGGRVVVRGGQFERPDSLRSKRDSLKLATQLLELDSIMAQTFLADSAALSQLRTDDIHTLDSITRAKMSMSSVLIDTTARRTYKKGWFMSDSMSLSKVCWLSTVIPGYGQIYNKQYWKLPILYGTVATGLALFFHESSVYRPLKAQYDMWTDKSTERTPQLDHLQAQMIRSNTKRQLYLGLSIASYLYFIGDAAVNYTTNDVSRVKKATTLACIFPGAGQIYNKSYWKVPFVVGGFASLIYCIDWNNRGYQRFRKAYNIMAEYEKNKATDPDTPPPTDEFKGRYSATYLKNLRNSYRRNRDLCIIITGALYILQIVDAHVDAHLKDYDISDDLSMNIEPLVNSTYIPSLGGNRPVFGFNVSLKF